MQSIRNNVSALCVCMCVYREQEVTREYRYLKEVEGRIKVQWMDRCMWTELNVCGHISGCPALSIINNLITPVLVPIQSHEILSLFVQKSQNEVGRKAAFDERNTLDESGFHWLMLL